MLIDKYRPSRYKEIFGQELAIRTINNWLDNWKQGEALLLYGPSGIGKTLIANVIAKERKLHLLEINPSESKVSPTLKNLDEALQQETILGDKIVLIDEVDGFFSENRSKMIEVINGSRYPVILTANNPFDQTLRPLRERCKLLKMRRVAVNIIFKKLKEISYKERFRVADDLIQRIAINSNGNMRSAINDLEIIATGNRTIDVREKEMDIFNILRTVFKTKDIRKALNALENNEKDLNETIWWVEQNILSEYKKPEEIAEAFEILSKADLHRNRVIKNQNYRFEKYAKDLLAALSLVKRKISYNFEAYRYPSRLVILGESKQYRNERDILLARFSKELHCSKQIVKLQLPYLEIITENFKGM